MVNRGLIWLPLAMILLAASAGLAAERTLRLSVTGMSCPTCPFIVKRSLERVNGVLDVRVSYEERLAVVRYDDVLTDRASLTQATADYGFPSKVIE